MDGNDGNEKARPEPGFSSRLHAGGLRAGIRALMQQRFRLQLRVVGVCVQQVFVARGEMAAAARVGLSRFHAAASIDE